MRLGMMVGRRVAPRPVELRDAYRPRHQFGNRLICALIRKAFGSPIHDVFSGFRDLFPGVRQNESPCARPESQIEAGMTTLQAISKVFPVGEMDVSHKARPKGSVSKLNAYLGWDAGTGGIRLRSARTTGPPCFSGSLAGLFGVLSLAAGSVPILDYMRYQWVYHVPLANLATGLALLSALSLCIGVILETQLRYHNEMHRLVTPGPVSMIVSPSERASGASKELCFQRAYPAAVLAVFVVVLIAAALQRFTLPLTPVFDPDTPGYLSPALSRCLPAAR